ncbi:hypothetical protein I6E74_02555 [Salinibacterium sp. SWN139]|uniref:hypothetical protein n=1 Tax=Salinibacterium sp. SWN139 TaxID=2792055 RepID=UPI0018CD5351|nr:hypothetical protein [Salinibacterium sp. SWN139]MBH0053049.1 hypothetical protein [Salinibacterium sp. SWN139]
MTTLTFVLWFGLRTAIIGLAIAVAWWAIGGRKDRLPTGAVATATLSAAGLALVPMMYLLAASVGFFGPRPLLVEQFWYWVFERRISWSLVLGAVAIAVLTVPIHTRVARGQATLTHRTPFSFGHRWWFGGTASIIGAIVTVTVLAGLASEPDPEGLWRSFTVEGANGSTFGTTIYGWYYSLPALALLAALIAVTLTALWIIARPPISAGHSSDVWMRQLRTRNVLAVASGALSLHLGMIFNSLASTATLRGGETVGSTGWASWGTPFEAMQPALTFLGLVAMSLGFALWFGILLSAIPRRRGSAPSVQS